MGLIYTHKGIVSVSKDHFIFLILMLCVQKKQIKKKIIKLNFDGDEFDKWAAFVLKTKKKSSKVVDDWSNASIKDIAKRKVFEKVEEKELIDPFMFKLLECKYKENCIKLKNDGKC